MNIKIKENGLLTIERSGEWVDQLCPFMSPDQATIYCSHNCPHFGEPFKACTNSDQDALKLCHGTTLTGTITDERTKP